MDALLRLLPPPRPPAPIDWADAERRMGTPLPSDLKQLVDLYGPGHLAGVIELLSPVEPRSRRNLVATARDEARLHSTAPSHLLLLALDSRGVPLLWQMIGAPDEWPILVGADLRRFEGTLSELLLAALEGRGPLPVRAGPPPPDAEPARAVVLGQCAEIPWDGRSGQAWLMSSVVFHWHTGAGSPDDWTVVLEETDVGLPAFWAFDGSATEMVLGIVEGALDVPALRGWDLGDDGWDFVSLG